jgi:hypothetical protein
MSKRAWVLALIAGVGIAALLLWVVPVGVSVGVLPHEVAEQCEQYPYSRRELCTDSSILTPLLMHIVAVLGRNTEAVVAAATVVIALFTATLWFSTRRLWESTKRSTAIAEEALKLQERLGQAQVRAYLSIKSVEITSNKKFPINEVDITISILNSGQSTASGVEGVVYAAASRPNLPPIEIKADFKTYSIASRELRVVVLRHLPFGINHFKFISLSVALFAKDVFSQDIQEWIQLSGLHDGTDGPQAVSVRERYFSDDEIAAKLAAAREEILGAAK